MYMYMYTPNLLTESGMFGYLILLAALGLVACGILLVVLRAVPRSLLWGFLALAFVPLLLGLVGWGMKLSQAEVDIARLGPAATPQNLAAGYAQARAPLWLGALATVPCLGIAFLALARPRSL